MKIYLLSIILLSLISLNAKSVGRSIDLPINLTDCPGVTVIEWSGSTINNYGIDKLNNICKTSVDLFKKNYPNKQYKLENIKVSIIPIVNGDDDCKYKNCIYYGWTNRDENTIEVINDVLDEKSNHPPFSKIFSHELFHVQSNVSGLYKIGKEKEDERKAAIFGKNVCKILEDKNCNLN